MAVELAGANATMCEGGNLPADNHSQEGFIYAESREFSVV